MLRVFEFSRLPLQRHSSFPDVETSQRWSALVIGIPSLPLKAEKISLSLRQNGRKRGYWEMEAKPVRRKLEILGCESLCPT